MMMSTDWLTWRMLPICAAWTAGARRSAREAARTLRSPVMAGKATAPASASAAL